MQVKPSSQPVVLSIPICHYDDTESAKASRRQLKEAIYKVLFDMNVPAVCAINQATLALYAARRTSGIVVNIGFQVTSIVPILNGKVMRKKLCYVAEDYEAELSKNTQASFGAGGQGWFTISKERFQTGEILFQPKLAGVRTMGLHQAVALCMEHCHSAELTADDAWFKTVVLSGGTACLPGLAGRLEKELHGLLPPSVSNGITVVSPPYGADTAWFGAKMIGNLSTFPGPWCMTKKQFRQKSKIKLMCRAGVSPSSRTTSLHLQEQVVSCEFPFKVRWLTLLKLPRNICLLVLGLVASLQSFNLDTFLSPEEAVNTIQTDGVVWWKGIS
ncbi:hypothetical protein C1H46_033628 [Malus baccata]|uniref:Actin-related protein 8 n=1 Tax=Malus baccata TaxID=106549 RepID=A0A540L2S2_MALBA|nr:hypothetical protein C1H46_033628 [Malus baccata]